MLHVSISNLHHQQCHSCLFNLGTSEAFPTWSPWYIDQNGVFEAKDCCQHHSEAVNIPEWSRYAAPSVRQTFWQQMVSLIALFPWHSSLGSTINLLSGITNREKKYIVKDEPLGGMWKVWIYAVCVITISRCKMKHLWPCNVICANPASSEWTGRDKYFS